MQVSALHPSGLLEWLALHPVRPPGSQAVRSGRQMFRCRAIRAHYPTYSLRNECYVDTRKIEPLICVDDPALLLE